MRISSGNGYSTAIKKDGSLWAFGWDQTGQIGMATRELPMLVLQSTGRRAVYSPLPNNRDWVALALEPEGIAYALKRDGELYVWGNGLYFPEHWLLTRARLALAKVRIRLPPHVRQFPTEILNLGRTALPLSAPTQDPNGDLALIPVGP